MKSWFGSNKQFTPGAELFRSDRFFSVWACTLSHGQLLLRSQTVIDGQRRSRIDVLFKPVEAMKTRMRYEGLTIRCATANECDRVLDETGLAEWSPRVFMLITGDGLDYVVAGAVGWQEDDQGDRQPSSLAFFVGGTDPTRLLPTDSPVRWSAQQRAAFDNRLEAGAAEPSSSTLEIALSPKPSMRPNRPHAVSLASTRVPSAEVLPPAPVARHQRTGFRILPRPRARAAQFKRHKWAQRTRMRNSGLPSAAIRCRSAWRGRLASAVSPSLAG